MADKINWSDKQIEAIEYRDGAAIVSAAAGSGKTAVLVERVKRLLLDPTDPVYADETVITTFTRKAAAEMRTRLETALDEALETADDPAMKKLISEQRLRLKDALICTTDSLCMNLLRQYSAEAGLRPDFRVLDDSQTRLLAEQAMKTVIDSFCEEEGDEAENTRRILYDRFAEEDDSGLEAAVRYLHGFSRKIPYSDVYFADQIAAYRDPDKLSGRLKDSYDAQIRTSVIDPLAALRDEINALYPLTQAVPPPILNKDGSVSSRSLTSNPTAPAGDAWREIADKYALAVWGNDDFWQRLREANAAYAAAKRAKTIDITTSTKQIAIDEIKTHVSELKAICAVLSDAVPLLGSIRDEMSACAPVLEALTKLTEKYDAEFARLKADKGGLDFDDMELMTLDMLRDENGGQSAVAKEIAASIRTIIVDEFQDSNEVQYEIYRLISRDRQNLYLVGDIKQSIYRFRGADPLVFQRLTQDGSGFKVLRLNKNFRSCSQVVDSVNAVFEGTMTVETGDVDYDDDAKLIQGKSYSTDDDLNRTELIEFNAHDSAEAREREAAYAAYRIKKMVAEGFPVSDGKNGTRPCQYGDFAIIMATYTNVASIYKKALDDAEIPFDAKDDTEYTSLDEVKYMLSMLRVIDDPYRDTDLAAVLMKEPYLFSADELAEIKLYERGSLKRGIELLSRHKNDIADIRKALNTHFGGDIPDDDTEIGKALSALNIAISDTELVDIAKYGREKRPDLWSGLKAYAKKNSRAADVLAEIEGYREFAAENSPARLIRKICDESMIMPSFEASKGGIKKGLNLRLLARYAESFPDGESASLYDFLQYLETLGKKKIKLTKAEGDSGSLNVVQMMTIHGSKGLEFPVCFLVNLQTDTGRTAGINGIVCDARYGIGMNIIDTENRLKISTYTYRNVLEEYKRLERSEQMRLLYVALTRAREKLIITVPQPPKNANESHWGWIRESGAVKAGLIVPESDPVFDADMPVPVPDDIPEVTISLDEKYEFREYSAIPAKFTATQIGVNSDFEHEGRSDDATREFRTPSFLKDGGVSKLTGKKRGDAYHKALELLDFTVAPEDVTAELDKICERGGITAAERVTIEDKDIAVFLGSDVCRRATACGRNNIYKEHPLFYEPSDSELRAICLKYGTDIAEWRYDEKPVIQGITDLFFVEGNEIVLVDYKTNTHVTEKDLIDEYRGQLAIYAHALEESMGMRVKERILYSFWLGKGITVTD